MTLVGEPLQKCIPMHMLNKKKAVEFPLPFLFLAQNSVMRYFPFAFVILVLVSCSGSDDTSEDNNTQPDNPFAPVDLSLLIDTAGEGTIKIMKISGETDEISITDLSGIEGLNGQCLMDFSESDKLTWINAYQSTYPIFQYSLSSENFNQIDQMCAIENAWIRSINYNDGIFALSSNYNDVVNSQINARVQLKGGNWDCDIFEVPESNALQSYISSNRLFFLTNSYNNQNEWRLSIFDLSTGILAASIEHIGMARYFIHGDFLYIMNTEGFIKYDLISYETVYTAPIDYYIEEKFGFNETRFHNNLLYIQTGYTQPSPYSHGITVLDTDTGNVVKTTSSTDFYLNLGVEFFGAFPGVFNFTPTSIEYLPEMDVIIMAAKDAASDRNFIVYTNFDAELLHVVEIPNPVLKIYLR